MSGAVDKAHKEADAARLIVLLGSKIGYEVEQETQGQQRKGLAGCANCRDGEKASFGM